MAGCIHGLPLAHLASDEVWGPLDAQAGAAYLVMIAAQMALLRREEQTRASHPTGGGVIKMPHAAAELLACRDEIHNPVTKCAMLG